MPYLPMTSNLLHELRLEAFKVILVPILESWVALQPTPDLHWSDFTTRLEPTFRLEQSIDLGYWDLPLGVSFDVFRGV